MMGKKQISNTDRKEADLKKPTNSSFGTGGGGNNFERRIQVDYFVIMLTNGRFPCFEVESKNIKWIKTQARPKYKTDDIVVCITDHSDKEHKLLIQIKHKLEFTKSDEEYEKTLQQAWQDFKGTQFDATYDLIVIATGPLPTQKAIDTVKPIFDAAAASVTLEDFTLKIAESKDRKEKYEVIQSILKKYTESIGVSTTEEEIWKFCKILRHLSYDCDYPDQSVSRADTISKINSGLVESSPYTAEQIYSKLLEIVAQYNQSGATRRRNDLPSDITACFRSYKTHSHEIDPWNSPILSERFVEQREQIINLYEKLKLIPRKTPINRIVISGNGGIGKTFLATYMITRPPFTYNLRVWFKASSREELSSEYKTFAESINVSTDLSLKVMVMRPCIQQ